MTIDPKQMAVQAAEYNSELIAQGIDPYTALQLTMNYQMLVFGQPESALAAPGWPIRREDGTEDFSSREK